MFLRLTMLMATVVIAACATVDDSGRAYFRLGNKVNGVEPAEAVLERMKKDQELREITYGQLKAVKIVQCTLLRNQLYVAAMKGGKSKEIMDAVKLMEAAYQDTDATFLAACDQVLATSLGKAFLATQQQYLMRKDRF